MKKTACLFLTVLMVISFLFPASAAGNALQNKFLRQFRVGNGLTGSLVIHGNADPEFCPVLSSVQNAEYSILCFQSEESTQYCIYQPGDSDQTVIIADYCILNGQKYLRSSFTEKEFYHFPDDNHIISLLLGTAEGENPPVTADILKMIFSEEKDPEINFSTEVLEKLIEMWVAGYKPETTIQKEENADPTMTQVFIIPVEDMYQTVIAFLDVVTQNEAAMNYLRNALTEEQVAAYFNPNLRYYYLDAMKKLDLKGSIVFSRTVSTMGKLLNNSLTLPLNTAETGFSSVTLQNDELRKSVLISGPEKVFLIDLPVSLDIHEVEYEHTIHFVHYDKNSESRNNVSLNIDLKKKHEEYNDPDEGISHETDHYKIAIRKDISFIPDTVPADAIADMDSAEGSVDIHYASKMQLSSPTVLEFSCAFAQGSKSFDAAGKITTTSPDKTKSTAPWAFVPCDTDNAIMTNAFTKQDFTDLFDKWTDRIKTEITHTPEEIRQTGAAE